MANRDEIMRQVFETVRRGIDPMFAPGTRYALIAFQPSDTENEVIATDEPNLDALIAVFERAKKRKAKEFPCGECHLQPGEQCDVCGARAAQGDST